MPWEEGCDPLTSAQGLRVVPVWVPHVDTLNDGRALLQGVAGVAGKLHYGPDVIGRVRCGEVPILNVGLIAVAFLKGWGQDTKEGSRSNESGVAHRPVSQKQGPLLLFREAPRQTGTRPHIPVPTDLLRALRPFTWLLGPHYFHI